MTKVRIVADIIMDDTPANRTILLTLWDLINTTKDRHITLFNDQENSKVQLIICYHDDNPPLPDVASKVLLLKDVIKDDVF